MTENLQAFFAQNAEQPTQVEKVISKRFKDGEGKPIPFIFKPISPERDAELKAQATKKTMITQGKQKGQFRSEFQAAKYQNLFTIESLAFPNLTDVALQDSYKALGEEDLFNKMLTPGEATDAFLAAQEANNYELDLDELVEQAKNS